MPTPICYVKNLCPFQLLKLSLSPFEPPLRRAPNVTRHLKSFHHWDPFGISWPRINLSKLDIPYFSNKTPIHKPSFSLTNLHIYSPTKALLNMSILLIPNQSFPSGELTTSHLTQYTFSPPFVPLPPRNKKSLCNLFKGLATTLGILKKERKYSEIDDNTDLPRKILPPN